MHRLRPFIVAGLVLSGSLLALASPASGQQDVPTVEVVKVNGAIDGVLADFLLGEIDRAEAASSTPRAPWTGTPCRSPSGSTMPKCP
jgi:membrane-bound ClpP family serine protease